ncbi:MAG: hypothetical protein H6613_09620 [Ignavibacteriales bacterium]|nr:hypothetical protein [Ignavibacteriales bacterium]
MNGSNTSPILINNIFTNNHSTGHSTNPNGHGIVHFSNGGGKAVIINNTIVNNSCAGFGGGISNSYSTATPLLINNIVYGNTPAQVWLGVTSDLDFYNCLIEGGKEGFTGAAFTGAYDNCIDADPQFVSSSDYHLQNISPCIGAAIDSMLISSTMYYCPPTDIEGNPRPNPAGSMPDIGAYENELKNPADIPEWITYNDTNSDLPGNSVECIKMDHLGNMWIAAVKEIGDLYYLIKYDGIDWTVYNLSNRISCLAIDEFDNKWIGTYDGLVKFDGTNWINYNTTNSELPDNTINCIDIDKFNNKWIGTEEGLVKYDDTNWFIYNPTNSDLPDRFVLCITIDDFNNKWIGNGFDLVKYNDTTWTVYDIPNPYGIFGLGILIK